MLETEILRKLQALWEEGERHDAHCAERREKCLNITMDTGRFLYQLARFSSSRHILEIGTSNGFSTIWLALAASASGGQVISLDVLPAKQQRARENLAAFGVESQVELVLADAADWLAGAPSSSIDLLFLDAERRLYPGYWPDIQRVLRSGGLLVMDNAQSHQDECRDFVGQVLATDGYLAETYTIGKGQFVILKDG
ncbi:O-methyltransferase, family 3 [Pseudogulbenkiania sp. NH8B]|uniref:O-methyltransferase n=1 Tax=Pseudogulbenkiania sp. (strain NH8B) TaxID=748280 RepID=UPI0002279D0D|nr:class I SAM-dependent methyltransferase [Pseudogulbenkiania sp. NH8B]BAK77047.1 O-methyltransferase, family 3 [Pseudogulbenkiania sp. NH8B]